MRKILFRGKRLDNGEWAEGFLVKFPSAIQIGSDYSPWYIIVPPRDPDDCGGCENVDSETVGSYTGLTDKNGKKIFEGDIVNGLFLFERPIMAVVTFQDGAFGLRWLRGSVIEFSAFTSICNVEYEVVGNIHDNHELMKGGAE